MKIIEIRKLNGDNKHRYVVFEGGERFFCPISVIKEGAFSEGSDVDVEEFRQLVADGEKRLAEDIAVKKLATQARSEKEIKKSLREKRIPQEAIDETVEKLERYHYIDDEAFVKSYLLYNGKKYGKRRILYVLTVEKGVDSQLAKDIINETLTDEVEYEKAVRAAEKYLTRKVLTSKDPRGKLYAHLTQKGYESGLSGSVAKEVLTAAQSGQNDDDDDPNFDDFDD